MTLYVNHWDFLIVMMVTAIKILPRVTGGFFGGKISTQKRGLTKIK